MGCARCSQSSGIRFSPSGMGRSAFAALSRATARAAVKSAGAIFRRIGGSAVHPDWSNRAARCERCPLRVVSGTASYCGRPFHHQPSRDVTDGCGCPTREKARDPGEHCPLTVLNQPATVRAGRCDCKWCA
ncbi:MAG TPA: hypothetical protein VEA69_06570 [Tepidisphaeraceae bacterium]|nr:hypothetical protein [Tepidisphaeraceae bacterium]